MVVSMTDFCEWQFTELINLIVWAKASLINNDTFRCYASGANHYSSIPTSLADSRSIDLSSIDLFYSFVDYNYKQRSIMT